MTTVRQATANAHGIPLPEWEGHGPCADEDPELFFNPANYAIRAAKNVCAGCDFRAQCLTGALQRQEPWGVFGGELFPDATHTARRNAKKTA